MTNEEAIKHITTWLYAAPALPPMQVVQALELAVNALRAGGKDKDVPTMSAGQPLTLEQLRGMANKPYWHVGMRENSAPPHWDILDPLLAYHPEDYDYGECWVAYAYPPARIDREAWEPCGRCEEKDCSNCAYGDDPEGRSHYKNCEGESWWRSEWTPYYDFCPWCGRPMTEHAWAKLEKRVEASKY